MKQLLRVAPIAFAVTFLVPAMTPPVASASPVDQKRNEVASIVDELERLEEQANRIAEDYVETIDAKTQLDADIVELEGDISDKDAEIGELRKDLGDMAIRSFVGSGTPALGPLFEDAADVNDVLQRDELARVALSAGDVTTDELDALVTDLQDDREELEDKVAEAEQLAESLQSAEAETERLTSEYEQARQEAEAELGQLIAEEEARRAAESLARVQAEIAAAQEAAAQEAAAAQSTASSGGGGNSGSTSSANSGSGSTNSSNTNSNGNTGGGSSAPAAQAPAPQAPEPQAPAPQAPAPQAPAPQAPAPAPAPTPQAPPPSSRASVAVNAAMSQQGVPYRYATSSPGVSFDCSGLTKYAWAQAGVYLPHQSRAQYASMPHVSKGSAQPGDLIFYYSPISHVGVYIGGGSMVHAPNTGSVVNVTGVNWGKVTGVGRPG